MIFDWILASCAVLLIVYTFPALRRFKQRYDFAQTMGGPSILESLDALRTGRLMEFSMECRQKYGTVFRLWLGLDLMVVFCDPDDVRTIVKSHELIDKSREYELLEVWLGRGLVTNGGETWRHKRKLLTPAFHFQILSTFKEPIEDCCEILVKRLTEVADGRSVNVYDYITLFALDVICETAMGIKVNAQLNPHSEYVKTVDKTCSLMQRLLLGTWQRIAFIYKWSADKKELDHALGLLHAETRRVIKLRRAALKVATGGNNQGTTVDMNGFKQRRPFLDSLLIAQRETELLTDTDIQEEVITFTFAGHDTSSSGITCTLFLLAHHPEVQQTLYEEITSPDNNTELPYLEAVLKESLRLYPSAPIFGRQSEKPFKIGKYKVPPFVSISMNVYVTHREPKYFPDPETFRPERFLPDAAPIHPFAYVPFSAGHRNCIGQRFAMLELRCCIARLVKAFTFSAVPNFKMQLSPEMVLSRNAVMVRIRKRCT